MPTIGGPTTEPYNTNFRLDEQEYVTFDEAARDGNGGKMYYMSHTEQASGLMVCVESRGELVVNRCLGAGESYSYIASFTNYLGYWATSGDSDIGTDGFMIVRLNEWLYVSIGLDAIEPFQTFADEEIAGVYYTYRDGDDHAAHILAVTGSYAITLPEMRRYDYHMPADGGEPLLDQFERMIDGSFEAWLESIPTHDQVACRVLMGGTCEMHTAERIETMLQQTRKQYVPSPMET